VFSDLVAVSFTRLALQVTEAGALWPRAAAGRGALVAQRDITTGRPPWMERPPWPGLCPARRVQGGHRHRASSALTAGWATALERWRGRQGTRVRLRDRRVERALQHARVSHVRQFAANVARPAGEQASTVPPQMPIVTTAAIGYTAMTQQELSSVITKELRNGRGNRNIYQVVELTSPSKGTPPTIQLKKRDKEQICPFGTGTELRSNRPGWV